MNITYIIFVGWELLQNCDIISLLAEFNLKQIHRPFTLH